MRFCLQAAILAVLFAHRAFAVAPPVKDGLLLNLDAAAQASLRAKAELPPISNSAGLDRWLSSAPADLHALQPWAGGRPVFRMDDTEAFLHFDGKDDFMSISGPKRRVSELTVFILAAPRGNQGGFAGMFAGAARGQNDYTSGINLDQGPAQTKEMSVLNFESMGAGGFQNFMQPGRNLAAPLKFDNFHVFTLRSRVKAKGNELFLDGVRLGDRDRGESSIGLDEMIVGGRFYSNDAAELPHAQGSFNGDIAAVLVYERALSEQEREAVEKALFVRTPALNALASGRNGHALEVLGDPPLVQMLVPGFSVEELPLVMRNLTNIRYRHDGKLVALGYDGRIHLVTDTDGDGREDASSIFWDKSNLRGPIGMALLGKNDPRGDGVFVASKGKVSLILDKDRDGVADEEIIVATGWQEITQSVDAIGLAVDPKDGSIYFGLGTANYANGYLIDQATGVSHFNLASDRGTIQRVSADFKKRETICTGVRFTCALAFNQIGDLFASEQEGATWLPNGNPFDELLHIQPGKHYGFPPRHPKHLPQVIDEPSVFDYSPQHQSTVGMIFNEGVNGGPSFGPDFWKGDALLCGESRGKIYRTKLVKTAEGYVAQNQIIASLGMLTIDACVTPKGDLLIACHSGPPDWGTGPAGEGKIFRIRHANHDAPQPVQTWASGPDEFRIAFDKPLKDADWAGVREQVRIEAGKFVAAGDRFEVIRPGYQVVRDQMTSPRRWVDVQSLSLSADRRTIVLRVPRQTEAVGYSITLPSPKSWLAKSPIPQKPEMDLAVTLNGVQASAEEGGQKNWTTLPHPSIAVSRAFTRGSADHEALFQQFDKQGASGHLAMRGNIKLSNIFVPAVQLGASLDWDMATDPFASRTMKVEQDFGGSIAPVSSVDPSTGTAAIQIASNGKLHLGGSGLIYALDDRRRPVALNRVLLPWASASVEKRWPEESLARTDVKGNWLRGRKVFLGDGGCVTCHSIRGEGAVFGPDLSNLVYRDRDSVLQDITKPSATINPDQAGSTIKFKDGVEINGLIRTLASDKIVIRQPGGVEIERPRGDVTGIEPMKNSLMPENLGTTLTAAQMEDLLTFLLTNPLEPTKITRTEPNMPPARTRAEIAPFLPPVAAQPDKQPPLRILLNIDDKDHGLDEHDYPLWQQRWSKLLPLADNVTVATNKGFPTRDQLANADVAVFYSHNSGWNAGAAALLDEFQARGGGLVLLHWAMEGGAEAPAYAKRVGLATGGSKYRHGELDLDFAAKHPITEGFGKLHLLDESYWAFHGDPALVTPLARSVEENKPEIQLWTFEHGKGRVFGSIPGHYMWTFDDPLYRVIVLRGIAWASHQKDINRLLDLAVVGARIAP